MKYTNKMNNSVEIIVGTYEEIIIGYTVEKENNKYVLHQSFTNHTHCGSIRTLAISDRYVASGSTDETVKLFNLRSRTEVGSLIQQEGSINCLQFHQNSHLFSGSEDGTICIWKPGNWQCLKTLRGHKGSVVAISIHPSGKLALSTSKDRTLKTWNLIKGRAAFTTNIKAVADLIQWSPDGTKYAVVINHRVDIYSVKTAGIVHTIDFGRKVNALIFITATVLALGGEGENIEFHAANQKAIYCILPTKTNRIKSLNCIPSPDVKGQMWLISSSSDGNIKIWNFDLNNLDISPELVTQVSTGCRVICQDVYVKKFFQETEDGHELISEENTTKPDSDEEADDERQNNEQEEPTATIKRKREDSGNVNSKKKSKKL